MTAVQPIKVPGQFIAKSPAEILPISPEARAAFQQAMEALEEMKRGAGEHLNDFIRGAGDLALSSAGE